MPDATAKPHEHTSVKETLISITIAFAMAFVFRAFVIEAYVIPTGSMAPTLMGQHMRFQSPATGYQWPVNPWQMQEPREAQVYSKVQSNVTVHDPMSGDQIGPGDVPRRAGDRILVLKYLHHFFDPSKFDVVVFKAPHDPQTNFIKRLLGLPGEQVALIDGDVFSRVPQPSDPTGLRVNTWALEGWRVDRKPERVQRECWQPVFDSAWTPEKPARSLRTWFTSPWTGGSDAGWAIAGRASYRHDGAGPARLDWDSDTFRIDDRYAYNEERDSSGRPGRFEALPKFPVSDVRMSLGLEPEQAGMGVAAVLVTREREFRASISGTTGAVQMRGEGTPGDGGWTILGEGDLIAPIPTGRVTTIEFWHVDQSLQLWVNGACIVNRPYDWTPAERVRASVGMTIDEALAQDPSSANVFEDTSLYAEPRPRWEFSGGPFTIHRVALARDLHFRPAHYDHDGSGRTHTRAGGPASATHPYSTPTLSPDQFMTCGDNSPASFDARLWDTPDPFVGAEIDPTIGVVPRSLMLGKAFFVYFPSTTQAFGRRVLPDFGRLRWIW